MIYPDQNFRKIALYQHITMMGLMSAFIFAAQIIKSLPLLKDCKI